MSPSFFAWLGSSATVIRLLIALGALALALALGFAAHYVARLPAPSPRASSDLPVPLVPLAAAPLLHVVLER